MVVRDLSEERKRVKEHIPSVPSGWLLEGFVQECGLEKILNYAWMMKFSGSGSSEGVRERCSVLEATLASSCRFYKLPVIMMMSSPELWGDLHAVVAAR